MDVTIRSAQPGDADALARCWLEMGRYYTALDPEHFRVPDEAGLVPWVASHLDEPLAEGDLRLVAEVDGRARGEVSAHIEGPRDDADRQILREHGRTRLLVDLLMVEEPFRRHGIGTALMRAAEEWARSMGAASVYLNTYIDSPTAVPFYERRMGYRRKTLGFTKALPHA